MCQSGAQTFYLIIDDGNACASSDDCEDYQNWRCARGREYGPNIGSAIVQLSATCPCHGCDNRTEP